MDYYDELKCTKSSSPEDITNSYRRLGLQWHPDRNHHNEDDRVRATNVFQRVSGAYTVLSDAGQRRVRVGARAQPATVERTEQSDHELADGDEELQGREADGGEVR